MRFGIGAKLGLLASALIIVTVLVLAWWMSRWSREVLVKHELVDLADETALRGEELVRVVETLRKDALQQAGRYALQNFLRLQPEQQKDATGQVRRDFEELLKRRPDYLQVEYLPLEDNREVPVQVKAKKTVDINSPSHLKYLAKLTTTKRYQVQLADVRRNDDARVDKQPAAVLRAAVPLFTTDPVLGPKGALIITMDFRALIEQLDRSPRHLTYLTDSKGHFLIHPDPSKAFTFEQTPNAPRIHDKLLPDLEPFYSPNLEARLAERVDTGTPRTRGFRYPDPEQKWKPPGQDTFILSFRVRNPQAWSDNPELHQEISHRLFQLRKEKNVVSTAVVTELTQDIHIRGDDWAELDTIGKELIDQYGDHLERRPIRELESFAVHYFRLVCSRDPDAPCWFGLARAASYQEFVADLEDQAGSLLKIKLLLIGAGVAVAFILAGFLTRPLKRIIQATRDLAQGNFDVQLPVKAGGEIGVLARCFRDMVDQLRQRGRQLREEETRLRVILKNAAEGIFILDEQGKIEMVNQAAEKIFGYTSDELVGQNVKLLVPKEVQSMPVAGSSPALQVAESIKVGKAANTTREVTGQRKDGTAFPLELAISEVPLGSRRLYTGIVRDITESKRTREEIQQLNQHLLELNRDLDNRVQTRTQQLQQMNEELAVARDQALEASRAKSTFLAQMSHELRTPLNAVKGYSELLLEEAEERGLDNFVPDLKKIIGAGTHLLALINDVLDLSKIEASKLELYLEHFDLQELVQSVVATVTPLVRKNDNQLQVQGTEKLSTMYADRTRLRQVLFNLLSNAAKFTHQGRIDLAIERQLRDGQDWICFVVRDTGIGIAADQMDKLFKPFSQADSATTRKYEGTGLGLVISRSFARMMGGDVTVESETDKGSVFTIHLPLRVAEVKPAANDGVARHVPTAANPILVIDDDPSARELMLRFLTREGFHVATAASGEEGLRLARQIRPFAITLDVMMPGMDGWEVLTILKADQQTADIPVIMLTIMEDKNLGYTLGATEYLTKPVDRERLAQLLKKYKKEHAPQAILVVEDDPSTRELLRRNLEKDGWIVQEAANGRLALASLTLHKPSLILLDLIMPEMDGFEFVAQLRENPNWCDIPVLVLTAKELTGSDRETLSGSVQRILQKNAFDREDLLRDLRELVGAAHNGE